MTVTAPDRLFYEYVADGLATERSIGFPLRRAADLVVAANGVPQVLGQHYSVVGTGPDQRIKPLAPFWPSGTVIGYWRQTARAQEYDVPAGVDIRNESLEDELDRMALQQQEQDAELDRVVSVPRGEAGLRLPPAAGRSNHLFAFDESGAAIFDIDADKVRQIIAAIFNPVFTQLASLVMFISSGLGAISRSIQDKLREVQVSITDYGAVSGGSRAINEAAFAAAIAAVQARGGGIVNVPVGQFDANTISVPDGPAVRIRGVGEQSIIRTTSATADLLTLTAWYSAVERVKIISSVTRTAGYYVHLLGAYTRAQDCHFDGDFVGVKMTGVGAKILYNVFSNGANGARRIWATGGDTSQTIKGNIMAAQAAGVAAGIFVDDSAALKITCNDVIGQGRCLHVAPGNGQSVFSLKSWENFYDTAGIGIAFEISGTGSARRCFSTGDWASSMTGNGALVSASGSAVADGIYFIGLQAHLNGLTGIATTGAGVKNVHVIGACKARQNAGAAVSIGAGVADTTIDGLQSQPADGLTGNDVAVFIDGAAGPYEIKNGNLIGQATAAIQGHTPAANKTVRDCKGFVTQARGTAVIPNGASSVTVPHGLAGTPKLVFADPQSDPAGRSWCEEANRTPTQFTINQSNGAVGYAVKYNWQAFYE